MNPDVGGGLNLQAPAGGTIEIEQYKIPHGHGKYGGVDTLDVRGDGNGHLSKSSHGVSMRDKYSKGGVGFSKGHAGAMDLQHSNLHGGLTPHGAHHVNVNYEIEGSDISRSRYNLGDNPYKKRWAFD